MRVVSREQGLSGPASGRRKAGAFGKSRQRNAVEASPRRGSRAGFVKPRGSPRLPQEVTIAKRYEGLLHSYHKHAEFPNLRRASARPSVSWPTRTRTAMLAVTEQLASLRTEGVDLLKIDPYSIYLIERQFVEAAEADENLSSTHWIEAAFLDRLRTDLQRECEYHSVLEGAMIGAKRSRIHATDHVPGNAAPWAQQHFRAALSTSSSSPLEDLHAALRDTIPELSAWARAEPDGERAKRRRHMMEDA